MDGQESGPRQAPPRRRKIVKIDEALCNGCGLCVTPCAEAALEVRDSKARVVREELCDGAGFCLGISLHGRALHRRARGPGLRS